MMLVILSEIRSELKKASTTKVRETAKGFFKEEIKLYGVRNPEVRLIGKKYFELLDKPPKPALFKLCEALLKSGYMEESLIACHWSYTVRKQFTPTDILIFEKWIQKYVNNWATCDTFCNHTVGSLIESHPEIINQIKKWAKSSNRWLRRAAAVSLIVPARKGMYLKEGTSIASVLLKDDDDLVQKGYGWLLKCLSKKYPNEVYSFVIKNKNQMPRTALRYAIEKLPEEMRREAMHKE